MVQVMHKSERHRQCGYTFPVRQECECEQDVMLWTWRTRSRLLDSRWQVEATCERGNRRVAVTLWIPPRVIEAFEGRLKALHLDPVEFLEDCIAHMVLSGEELVG